MEVTRLRAWGKQRRHGSELVQVTVEGRTLRAHGLAIGAEPEPYRLEFELTTTDGFVTKRLFVRTGGLTWFRTIDLQRTRDGNWACTFEDPGDSGLPTLDGDMAPLAGALDCDLDLSPFTSSMPILRHSLHEAGGPIEFLMARVSVPDLRIRPSRQRYAFVRRQDAERIVHREDLDRSSATDISVDDDGLVLDYSGLARCLGTAVPTPFDPFG